MKQTIISILNFNGSNDTIACLKSFLKYECVENYCLVIWDNASNDLDYNNLKNEIVKLKMNIITLDESEYGKKEFFENDCVLVRSKTNYGFAIANNKVLRPAVGYFDFYVLLNNDTEFSSNTTEKCIDYLKTREDIGILSTSIYYYYDPEKVWNAGGKFIFGWRKYYTNSFIRKKLSRNIKEVTVDYITGCYMIIREETIRKVGLLSENFFFGEEDFNYCYKMKQNHVKLAVRLDLRLLHKVGATGLKNKDSNKIRRYTFIYYLNRFVDMKSFLNKPIWNIWCTFSSVLCFRNALKLYQYNMRCATQFVYNVMKYRNRDNVDKSFFQYVLDGNII